MNNTTPNTTPLDGGAPKMTEKQIARFWSKVDKTSSANGCWLWASSRARRGYGQFSHNGKTVQAHRVAWQLTNGPIPVGLLVCHNCPCGDNRACCNPTHLWIGTHADNTNDAKNKGTLATGGRSGRHTKPEQTARGERHGSRTHPEKLARGERHGSCTHPESLLRGEKVHTAKLAEIEIIAIRAIPILKYGDIARIAFKFGVTRQNVRAIINNKTWKHLLPTPEIFA